MADASLRALERRFADEGDLAAGRELVASRRRVGEAVCGPLLAADVRPGRTVDLDLPLAVHVLTEHGSTEWVGNTPTAEPLVLPAHRTWWVRPLRSEAEQLGRTVEAVAAQGIPGLEVSGRSANGLIPPLPDTLELLRIRRRRVGRSELDLADADPPLEVPGLTRLLLDAPGTLDVDPGPLLTEASLNGIEAECRALLQRWAGRELPLTKLDVRTIRELDLGEAVWEGLPGLRALSVATGILACPEAPLAHLERLDLDVMLAHGLEPLLASCATSLRDLRFTGALANLEPVAPLARLRSLVLGSSLRAQPAQLAQLACWTGLERLGLSANLQAGWADALSAAQALEELSLDRADRWPSEAFRALHHLPRLRVLSVRSEPGSAAGWLPLLEDLPLRTFHYQGGSEADFDALPPLPELRRLHLEVGGAGWTSEQLLRVLSAGRLEELELVGALVPAAVLEALPTLQPALRSIRVHVELATDRTLAALGQLPRLRELDLLGVEPQDVSQAGWKRLLEGPVQRLRLGVEPPSTSWRQALRFTLHALRANLDLGW